MEKSGEKAATTGALTVVSGLPYRWCNTIVCDYYQMAQIPNMVKIIYGNKGEHYDVNPDQIVIPKQLTGAAVFTIPRSGSVGIRFSDGASGTMDLATGVFTQD